MIELGGQKTSARVFDLSRGGARIAAVPHVSAGADATVTFAGMRPMKGKVAWIAGGCFGVRFEPVMLEARRTACASQGSTRRGLTRRPARPAAPAPATVRRRTTSRCSA